VPVPEPISAAPGAAVEPLSIVFVSPEAHPFAKTGGLAEVAAARPAALAALGHRVTLGIPRYRGIDTTGAASLALSVRLGDTDLTPSVFERQLPDGVTVALVDVPALFDREGLYGDPTGDYPDNPWRFAVFSRAAIEYVRARGVRPSVIHAHDWQTGLVAAYQKMLFSTDPVVGGVPAVFTIHNLAFQGIFPASTLDAIGLGWEVMHQQAMEYWGQISYLKAGINFSERITTVSPTYAQEITQPELGFGFDGILRRRAADLVGILNGIDTSRWNPAADEYVPAHFTAGDLAGKRDAKRALLDAAIMASDDEALARPLIGLISRMTDQKGFDLMDTAARDLLELDATWVMLGSGEHRYEEAWRSLAQEHPERVSTTIGFDERLAHLIEAGADMFLMPSRFEPCGLNQLYSLRYGTLPIVRATGGLKDTVVDAAEPDGTGFTFTDYTPEALLDAVRRALAAFRQPDVWRAMQRRAMELDHSWDASAREYVKVYRALAS
jgi:starch synthase